MSGLYINPNLYNVTIFFWALKIESICLFSSLLSIQTVEVFIVLPSENHSLSEIYIQYAEMCRSSFIIILWNYLGKNCDPVASQAEEVEAIFKINKAV